MEVKLLMGTLRAPTREPGPQNPPIGPPQRPKMAKIDYRIKKTSRKMSSIMN